MKMGKTKYIFTSGKLSRKDFSLCYRDVDNNINYFPIEEVREIYILNEVSINTKLLDFLGRYGIFIHFFNYYGNYSGTFCPKEEYLSGRLLVQQLEKYKIDRIRIAKSIVKGIALNIIEVLYHYHRHNKPVKEYIDNIRKIVFNELDKVEQIKRILYIEGFVWKEFYSALRIVLHEDFYLKERVKRPPDNPINALISFGNTMLYTKTVSAIYQTHLNPTISYLHEPAERRFSLALDISEVFKPIIVFRTILDLVNKNRISKINHFDKNMNYAVLNEEGKKIFIAEFENRLNKVIEHKKLKRKVTYQTLLKYDCYKLIKDIMEGVEFIPYNDKNKE